MKLSLKFKFTLFTSSLILAIGVGSGVYFATQAKSILEGELRKLGVSFVVQFAMDEDVRNALYLEQPAFLDTPVNRLRELDVENELAYCRVLLPSGESFREDKEEWLNINIDNVTELDKIFTITKPEVSRFIIKPDQDDDNAIVRSDTERSNRLKETFFDFMAPVFDKKGVSEEAFASLLDIGSDLISGKDTNILGYVQIGLSSAQINKRLWKILFTGIIPLSLATMVGGFWVLYSIVKKVIKPIAKLVDMSVRVSKGDLEYRVDVKSNDEIRVLADSFNKMAKELKLQMDEKERVMQKLKELNAELENSNVELIKANEQLKDAQDQVVRSEKLAAVGQLASSVAHELRNPIGAIKNSLFYMKRKLIKDYKEESNSITQLIGIVEKETDRSSKIISDLLGFAQTSKPSSAPTDIKHVIEEAHSRITMPTNIETIIDIDPNLPKVLIDSAQIGQVFLNLIQNSYQAMPDGGKLEIKANNCDEFVKIEIKDSGLGIPQKLIGKVFDPLFTTKINGIGLGLAFSYEVIQRHNADIEVSSVEGEGTAFVIKIRT